MEEKSLCGWKHCWRLKNVEKFCEEKKGLGI